MNIKIIETGGKEYDDMTDLRMKVLLDPVGIPRSSSTRKKKKMIY